MVQVARLRRLFRRPQESSGSGSQNAVENEPTQQPDVETAALIDSTEESVPIAPAIATRMDLLHERKLFRRLFIRVIRSPRKFGWWLGRFGILVALCALLRIYRLYRQESQPSPFLDPSLGVFRRGVAPPPSTFVFPSVEVRIRYYMADWFDYYHQEMTQYNITTTTVTNNNTTSQQEEWLARHLCRDVPYWEPGMPTHKFPYRVDAENLREMQFLGWPKRLPWRYFKGPAVDLQTYHVRPEECPRAVVQLGDAKDKATHLHTPFPLLVKSRWSTEEYERRYVRETTATHNNKTNTQHAPPILGLAHVSRHYEHFRETDAAWDRIPWEEKLEAVVWRGATSGKRRAILRPYFGSSSADAVSSNSDFDIGFSYALDIHKRTPDAESMVKGHLSVRELLKFKYLLVLEGWGIASSLKWMLYSNSVVFMAKPTKVSWAMEEKLIPYVHYVPVQPDLSDLASQLEWARDHDEECRTMALHSRDYMERLVTSPRAQRETREILEQLARRYHRQFGPLLESCETAGR